MFWVDPGRSVELSYDALAADLSTREVRHPVVRKDDPVEALSEVLLGLLASEDVVLLDSEFSEATLADLGYGADAGSRTVPAPDLDIPDGDALAVMVRGADPEWTLGLYTSGTTGTPTRVEQTFAGLTRGLRTGKRFVDDVWAFAYEPTHIAGLQVLFQAVANRNPLVYVFESDPAAIGAAFREYGATHVSATPTFHRLRLARLEGTYPAVRRVTSGGEPFDAGLRDALAETFPNAAVRNVYALTETGTLLESDGEAFQILDNRVDDLCVAEDGELLVRASLLDEATRAETDGEWYGTGDLVERVDDDSLRFVGRRSDVVDVAGYRVSPREVERRVEDASGVAAAVVSTRDSSVTGHVLVADVTVDPDADPTRVEDAVEEEVADLPPWKRPRVVTVVDDLPRTRSGKRVRGQR